MSINSLDSDLFIYLLSFLPPKEWFRIERVNKKWQKCVRKLMSKRITEFGNHSDLFRPFFWMIDDNNIDDNSIDVVRSILSRCQSVKYLNFERMNFDTSKIYSSNNNNLLEIAKLCPKLERINLNFSTIKLSIDEWEQFAKLIGPKLIRCDIWLVEEEEQNMILTKILFKHLKMIEKVHFNTPDNRWDKGYQDKRARTKGRETKGRGHKSAGHKSAAIKRRGHKGADIRART